MGVDIARHGEDHTVIRFRRGLDARSIPPVKFRIPDLMVVAGRVMEQVNAHSPDAVFVDGTGIGWGVVDRLSQLGCGAVRGVAYRVAYRLLGTAERVCQPRARLELELVGRHVVGTQVHERSKVCVQVLR